MITLYNLSNGTDDGFMLSYIKNGTVYPVMLTKSQAHMLDIAIVIPFKQEKAIINFQHPQGKAVQLLKKD